MSDYFPEGNLLQIFKSLPVKTLLRFRCVCTEWKTLIDCPTLILDHLAVQNPLSLLQCKEPEYIILDPLTLPLINTLRSPIEDEAQPFVFIGTLHGVVCLYYNDNNNLLLWNPSLRKSSTLHLPSVYERAFREAWKTSCGFWIDPSSKEFKIVILMFVYDDDIDERTDVDCILYSSLTHDWSVIYTEAVGIDWFPWRQGPPVMIGGVAHWEGLYEFIDEDDVEDGDDVYQTNVILSFDFGQECFELIEIPDLKCLDDCHIRVCHWRGTLSVVYWDPKSPRRCTIYSRQEDSWAKRFVFKGLGPVEDVMWVLDGIREQGRVLVAEKDDSVGFKLALYDTKGGCIPLTRRFRCVPPVAYDFVESLLLPSA